MTKQTNMPDIAGIRSAYAHALKMRGENMLIASSLVVELIDWVTESEQAPARPCWGL